MAGQIIKRGDNKWLVRVFEGRKADGKRKYVSKTVHGNKKVAAKVLNEMLTALSTTGVAKQSNEFLADYLDTWLEDVARNRVTEKTLVSYRSLISSYIRPDLGDTILSKLRSEQIQKLYNSMIDRGLSPRTVRYTHAVLNSALSQAVKWERLQRNPAELVDLPKQKKKEMHVLTPTEASQFMNATIYSPWKALFSLLLSSGMRPGEALALKWVDIDFERGRVHVQRSLSTTTEGWRLKEPKTPRSRRSIPLPSTVLEDLQEHKVRQAAERETNVEAGYTDNGLVFANELGNPLDHHNLSTRHFKPLLKAAGLPDIRLYDLRHSCATLLLSAGENPKIVAERLGHASITLTLDTYSHVLPHMQENATAKLETMLFRSDPEDKRGTL